HRLDAFRVQRLLELLPGRSLLYDAAMTRTVGTSTLLGLRHPHVQRVCAVTERYALDAERALAATRDYIASRGPVETELDVVERSELPSRLAEGQGIVILTDARDGDAAALAEEIGRWLDARPDGLVLVLGLGRVGECPAIATLLALCTPESRKRFQLLREQCEVFMASRLGLVAQREHPHLGRVIQRLQQLYTSNYTYL